MKDIICFGGDSFTWGEGLELYIDSSYWIKQRTKLNTWLELSQKQTTDSNKFREQNRFAKIVSDYFNSDSLVLNYNGGGFDASPIFFDNNLTKIPKSIIYQFTAFARFNLHFSKLCKCEFCNSNYGSVRPYDMYLNATLKKIENIDLSDAELFYLKWLKDNKGIEFDNIEVENMIKTISTKFVPLFLDSMAIFVSTYLKKWNEMTNVYLIDSWDEYTSELIETIPEIKSKLIPLKGWDGNWYYKWKEWETTFPYKRIQNEFPATQNGHPTLIQHQYIAESIIQAMKK